MRNALKVSQLKESLEALERQGQGDLPIWLYLAGEYAYAITSATIGEGARAHEAVCISPNPPVNGPVLWLECLD